MAEAGRIVALVHEKLKEVIVPGITTKQIDEICEKVIRDNNATILPASAINSISLRSLVTIII